MKKLTEMGFVEIHSEDITRLKEYYHKMEDSYASSIDLLSIFAWKDNLPAYYKEVEGYLCFLVFDKVNARWVSLPLIGDYQKERTEAALHTLEGIFERLHIPLVFTDVTPWMLPFYRDYFKAGMEVVDIKELAEYIYPTKQFLQNLQRQRERYNYNYFINKNEIITKKLDRSSKEDCLKILEESFCCYHSCEECEYGCQKDTLSRALAAMGEKDTGGFIVYADGAPVAYNMVSIENRQIVFHFKKNKKGFRGMNEYIHKEALERFGLHTETINYTEDMGVGGLKKYKSGLCSYTLQPKLELRIKEDIRGRWG